MAASAAGAAGIALQGGPARAQVTAAPKRGGTVTIAVNQAPPSMDAQVTSASTARDVTLHLYETLYARDESGTPTPDLATGVEISGDGLTYTFPLRHGVPFHNGKEMMAADVVASIRRYGKVGATVTMLSALDRIEATDPHTVTMRLKAVQSTFLDNLSSPRAPIAIYPAEEAEKPLDKFQFIGTGPFRFVEYRPDSHVRIERFPDYALNPAYKGYAGFAGRKEVFIDSAIYRFMPESSSRLAALQTGEIQIDEFSDGPSSKQLASNPAWKIHRVLPFYLMCAKFNYAQPPCNDIAFRRAVQAALDMGDIMDIAFPDVNDLNGGWVFANSQYYTKAGLELYNQHDPAKAKALLKQSSYKGEKLTFIIDNSRADVDIATSIVEQLGRVGINVAVSVMDWPTVSKIGYTPNGWHFWAHGFGIEPFEGPASVMAPWVNGVAQLKDDPEIDKLYAAFNAELDLARRKDIFASYQRYVYEQAAVMQLGNYGITQVVSARLQNFVPFRIPRMWGTWLA